jgi:hypothetical protein
MCLASFPNPPRRRRRPSSSAVFGWNELNPVGCLFLSPFLRRTAEGEFRFVRLSEDRRREASSRRYSGRGTRRMARTKDDDDDEEDWVMTLNTYYAALDIHDPWALVTICRQEAVASFCRRQSICRPRTARQLGLRPFSSAYRLQQPSPYR